MKCLFSIRIKYLSYKFISRIVFLLFCLIPVKNYCQINTSDTVKLTNIDSIVVSTTHIPVTLKTSTEALSIVTKEELKGMYKTIAADEAMRFVPGITIDNQANGSRIHMSVRGQGILSERGIRGIKFFVDGIPINDPTGFAPDLYDIDWETVRQIEVLRGPLASVYGGGSNGGIVNILTDDGGDYSINSKALISSGSNGFYKLLGQINGSPAGMNCHRDRVR